MRSFDTTRDRPAPRSWRGSSLDGQPLEGVFERTTVVVAVKEDCWGCRSVFESPVDAFGDVATLIVARSVSSEPWWRSSGHRVVVSPELLDQLDVRWPPFYVVVDPLRERVVCEGVVFAPEQVKTEIAAFLM
jgi:hypothetical protein